MDSLNNGNFSAFIGLDWANSKHDICVQAAGSDHREFSQFLHTPASIDQWAHAMHARFGGLIAVALELSKGPIVYALQKYDFFIIFPINPTTLAKYREAFQPSHAKDDPTDAEHALELLLRHPDKFKPLRPQSAAMRTLLCLVEQRRRLVGDMVRYTNRLCDALKQYFPQALDWFPKRDSVLFCDFLTRWPALTRVKLARKSTLVEFFNEHNVRGTSRIEGRIAAIKAAVPLTNDAAIIVAYQSLALALVDQLRATIKAIDGFDKQIAAIAPTLPDYSLFSELPGAGAVLAPRLLVAFGEQRERFRSANELQRYAGIAPVTERSGQKSWVHWRWQCPKFLRQTMVEWAAQTI
ncbi:MAG: IS110 family transposase, partial [Rhodoferax sp.]|nr:IS110 family transposase [Pseudorhodobacter sp.]